MKLSMSLTVFWLVGMSFSAQAYEYPLHFKPNPGYRGLVVAGYKFEGNTVVGTCSYYTVSGNGSGRGGHGRTTKYDQTCRWDTYGNLISMTPGTLPLPVPLYTKGSLIVYAENANGDYTGTDSKLPERGFVSTPGGHYTWLTPDSNAVLQQIVYTLNIILKSDGDVPVNITHVAASALHGAVTLKSTNCVGQIKVGATCTTTVTYDPTKLKSSTELISDTFRVDLTSDAGVPADFIQNFTIIAFR